MNRSQPQSIINCCQSHVKEDSEKTQHEQFIQDLDHVIEVALLRSSNFLEKKNTLTQALIDFKLPTYPWDRYILFGSDSKYKRNLILSKPLYELMTICWPKSSETPIHDHPSDGCWMAVLEGELKETRYKKLPDGTLKKSSELILRRGDVSYIHNVFGYHCIVNNSVTKGTVSLHIYSPPIKRCNIFTTDGEQRCIECDFYSENGSVLNERKTKFIHPN